MNRIKMEGPSLPNIPWEERPEGYTKPLWRYSANPVIARDALPDSNSIFNSAVVPFRDGFAGVFRCDDTNIRMTLHVGFSKDGIHWDINPETLKFVDGRNEIGVWEYGYDPRVAKIGDKYYVTWCNGYHGPTIGIAWTEDFKTFHQMENAFLPYNRNGVLFPRKIGGRFAMLSRPSDTGHTPFGDIFYSESPDMEFWGRHRFVLGPSAFEKSAWQCCKTGAVCPNGLMSVSPFNVMGSDTNVFDKDSRWWSTPYSSDNCFFTGFSHVNLSGVGCPEVGLALTMPTGGPLEVDYHLYGTTISHEQGRPGYYACSLDSYGIKAEVTSTVRTAVERYTYPAGCGNILVNFGQGLTNETGAWIRRLSDTEIEGMRLAGTFCYNPQAVFPVYFAIRISKTPSEAGFWKKQPKMKGVEAEWTPDNGHYKIYKGYQRELAGDNIGYWFSFETFEGEQVELQIAVSFVSCANAWDNLRSELGDACSWASCS